MGYAHSCDAVIHLDLIHAVSLPIREPFRPARNMNISWRTRRANQCKLNPVKSRCPSCLLSIIEMSFRPPPFESPTRGPTVQRSNSLKPQSSSRSRPSTDPSSRAYNGQSIPTSRSQPLDDRSFSSQASQPHGNYDEWNHRQGATNVAPGPAVARRESMKDQARARPTRQVGDWMLGKTIGAGSMGKVKTAINVLTGEKVASSYRLMRMGVGLSLILLRETVCSQDHPPIQHPSDQIIDF
jgi:hypothetical protein